MNKLPDHVYVLGQHFRVELVHNLKSDGDPVSGETVGEYHRIRIDAGLDMARQWQVLVHEYVHAVLHMVGVGNFLNDGTEEVVAQSLEYGITQLLRQYGKQLIRSIGTEEHK